MKLHFHGGAEAVTGVNYLLETGKSKILVDCGLFQGPKELEARNSKPFEYDAKTIDAVIITHSHLDHVGRLPQLIDAGFRGKIFATPPAVNFTRLILEDSVRVLAEKAQHAGVVPMFSQEEVNQVMSQFVPVDYYKKTKAAEDIEFTYHNAGHILGSAIVELDSEGKKIVFSGDLGHPPAPLLRAPDYLICADYVLVESTYGDRNHESPEEGEERIENVIEDTISKGGVLMIPSFAMERTQQLLYHINDLIEHKRIPRIPVYIDSPLATHITEVYKKYPQYYNKEAASEIDSGDDVFNFPGLRFTLSSKESKEINDSPSPKVIIAGSGMSNGGRIVHHEVRYLSDPKNTLLMVGYQAEGTLGRRIADGQKRVVVLDQEVEVRAKVEKISGYSAHADQFYLMDWIKSFKKIACGDGSGKHKLTKVFVVQGEAKPAAALASLIRDELGITTEVPKLGETVEL
ncbi:MAG: MBL fold metallo-hydrolase [Candidatus Portnoybacteria bacterium]|nr:MBL fold metallo-hydrolase [Candidatus Portnoybacteria bacterium]MDD4982676.1 MBL fold metallo-hydrolase [Candidatus Portnoybacteria bacterium]